MTSAEMTEGQLSERDLFARRLRAAGWDDGGWDELFSAGVRLTPEAQAEYQNSAFSLRLGYFAGGGYVRFECVRRRDGLVELCLHCYPRRGLTAVLDALGAAQDSLSPDNYPEFVKTLIPLCDPLLMETPDGLFQLS